VGRPASGAPERTVENRALATARERGLAGPAKRDARRSSCYLDSRQLAANAAAGIERRMVAGTRGERPGRLRMRVSLRAGPPPLPSIRATDGREDGAGIPAIGWPVSSR